MKSERDSRRRLILSTLERLSLRGWVLTGRGGDIRHQRDALLRMMVELVDDAGATSIHLDHIDFVEQERDRRVLARALRHRSVAYEHAPFAQATDPHIWAADAIAWAAGRPEFRRRLPSWVDEIRA